MLLSNGGDFLIGTISLMLMTSLFTAEITGAWMVFLSILFVATKFREGMLNNIIVKFSVDRPADEKNAVYNYTLLTGLFIEVLTFLLLMIVSLFLTNEHLIYMLSVYLLISVPQLFYRWAQQVLLSQLRTGSMAFGNGLVMTGLLVSMPVLFVFEPTIWLFMGMLSISFSFGAVGQILRMRHNFFVWNAGALPLRSMLSYATNGMLRELSGTIASRSYIFFTAGLVSMNATAMLGVASRYANLIYLPNSAYQGFIYPTVCSLVNRGKEDMALPLMIRALRRLYSAFAVYVIPLIAAGALWIYFFHGTDYIDSILPFAFLILTGAFVAPLGHAFGSYMHAIHKPEIVTKLVMVNSIATMILGVILTWLLGLWGGLFANLIVDLGGIIWMSFYLRQQQNRDMLLSFNGWKKQWIDWIALIKRILNPSAV